MTWRLGGSPSHTMSLNSWLSSTDLTNLNHQTLGELSFWSPVSRPSGHVGLGLLGCVNGSMELLNGIFNRAPTCASGLNRCGLVGALLVWLCSWGFLSKQLGAHD